MHDPSLQHECLATGGQAILTVSQKRGHNATERRIQVNELSDVANGVRVVELAH